MSWNIASYQVCRGATSSPQEESPRVPDGELAEPTKDLHLPHFLPLRHWHMSALDSVTAQYVISVGTAALKGDWIQVLGKNKRHP